MNSEFLEQTVSFLNTILVFLSGITQDILSFWWLIVPLILVILGIQLWRFNKEEEYKHNMDWTLLEIKAPREMEKTPKAMEQVFAAVHAIESKVKFKEKWLEGKVEDWITFELVGRAGSIHFMVRTPSDYRNLVESSIYAQYPEADISVVPEEDDYVNEFPPGLPNQGYDIWGTEFVLKEDDGYPLRTYEYFEDKDEKRLDPIAAIIETMSNLKPSEAIWLQFLLRPADDKWVEKGEKLAEKLWKGKKKDKSSLPKPFNWIADWAEEGFRFARNFFVAFFKHPSWDGGDSDDKDNANLSPGKKKIVEGVENKISKLGFNGALRFLYVDKKDRFTKSNVSSVVGSLRQFNTNNMNRFEMNKNAMKGNKFLFSKNRKTLHGKRKFYSEYITRNFPKKTSVFNTEELATLYHFPLTEVKPPKLRRTDFRKGGPPSDLPTIQ